MKKGKVLISRASSIILSLILTVAVSAGMLAVSPQPRTAYADETYKVTITNTDDNGKVLAGGDFAIYSEGSSEPVMTFTSDGNPKEVSLAAGNYVLKQTKAADGYKLADDVPFKVASDGTLVGSGTEEFTVQGLGLELRYITDSNPAKEGVPVYTYLGKECQFYDDQGNAVPWESTYGATMSRLIAGGDSEYVYCFNKTKTSPPDAYTGKKLTYYSENSTPEIIEKSAMGSKLDVDTFYSHILGILYNGFPNNAGGYGNGLTDRQFYAVTQWAIWHYTDGANVGSESSPEVLMIPDGQKDNSVWTQEMHDVYRSLIGSTYSGSQLVRFLTTQEAGYQNMIGAKFIDRDQNLTVVNHRDLTKFTVKKVDENGDPVKGATLQIKARTESGTTPGEPVEEWTTDGSAKILNTADFTNPYGYVISESEVPEGYAKAKAAVFRIVDGSSLEVMSRDTGYKWVKNDEAVISLVDIKKQEVEFNKVDIDTGKTLKGAELALVSGTKESGTEIESWTTDGSSHKISLAPGYYTLKEKTAPDGYETAPSVTFYLYKDGTIAVLGPDNKWSSHEEAFVTMQDSKDENYPNRHSINVSKVDAETGEGLSGAVLDVVIGSDENGTSVARWTTDGKAHRMRGLPEGTYTLVERSAPEGYDTAAPITFRIDSEGKVRIVNADGTESEAQDDLTMKDPKTPTPVIPESHSVAFSKVNSETGSALAGAELELVIGSDDSGTSAAKWTTDGTMHYISGLAAGTYTLVERTAPEGYELADPITFRLDETGLIHIIGSDGIESDAQMAIVTMKDEATPTEVPPTDETTTPRDDGGKVVDDDTEKTTVNSDSGKKVTSTSSRKVVKVESAPRTGDDSNAAAWIIIAAAAGISAAAIARKRRSQKN
jgi:TQXA domain-containing protein